MPSRPTWKWAMLGAVLGVASSCDGSSSGTATPPPLTPPQNVSARAGLHRVTIAWDPVEGATSYDLYSSTSPGVTPASTKTAGVTSPHVVTGLAPGVYHYAVSAIAEGRGESPLSAEASDGVRLVAFVTSATGTGNLGGWAAASGAGVAAGDAICQSAAVVAGLTSVGSGRTFVAWLSDSTTDAACHLRGLTGQVPTCGLGALPATPTGPWTRTDGTPFADDLESMLGMAGRIYTPMRYDERGNDAGFAAYFTGTGGDGALMGGACGGWTAATTAYATAGATWQTIWGWTDGTFADCSRPARLLCLETGSAPRRAPRPAAAKKAFVTSTGYSGNLGGLAGADAKCQARAAAAGLANASRFKAWLSTSTVDAGARLTSGGPWARIDGILLASSLADLTADRPLTSLAVDETGAYVWESAHTATSAGVFVTDAPNGSSCNDWTYEGGTPPEAAIGSTIDAASAWSYSGGTYCTVPARLYCFED